MDQLVLRRMQEADLDQIAFLEAEIFSDPWSRKSYEDILNLERYCGLVLAVPCQTPAGAGNEGSGRAEEAMEKKHETDIAGYLCGMSVLEEGELHRIAVSPALRGQGYGQRLLEGFLEVMRGRGVRLAYLEVRAGNGPAIGLYEKNGFVSIGIRKGYYQNPKEDAQIMQKTL